MTIPRAESGLARFTSGWYGAPRSGSNVGSSPVTVSQFGSTLAA